MVLSTLSRFLFSLLPTPIRIQGFSFLKNYLLDFRDELTGRFDHEVPPRHLNISGEGPFLTYGLNTVDLCRKYAGLQPDHAVLDIGCGIGRTAIALKSFLLAGRYVGFDIIRFAVEWCNDHISASNPTFQFIHADIYNFTYNPRGVEKPEHFTFPFAPASFTFALATSVFTHVLPPAAENYVRQAAVVLKTGARFLSTWFLLDEISEAAIAAGRARLQFPHRFALHAQGSARAPEQSVAFPRAYVISMFENSGFLIEAVYRGDWSNTPDVIDSMQDVIVARRR